MDDRLHVSCHMSAEGVEPHSSVQHLADLLLLDFGV